MFWFDKERSLVKCALNEWSQKDCIRCAVRMFIKKAFSVTCRRKAGFRRHPLRPVREMVDIALSELSGQFESMYSDTGRRSIPPEKLLRALLLQILYSIRSERMLCEQLDYNLLFRWFIGLSTS